MYWGLDSPKSYSYCNTILIAFMPHYMIKRPFCNSICEVLSLLRSAAYYRQTHRSRNQKKKENCFFRWKKGEKLDRNAVRDVVARSSHTLSLPPSNSLHGLWERTLQAVEAAFLPHKICLLHIAFLFFSLSKVPMCKKGVFFIKGYSASLSPY